MTDGLHRLTDRATPSAFVLTFIPDLNVFWSRSSCQPSCRGNWLKYALCNTYKNTTQFYSQIYQNHFAQRLPNRFNNHKPDSCVIKDGVAWCGAVWRMRINFHSCCAIETTRTSNFCIVCVFWWFFFCFCFFFSFFCKHAYTLCVCVCVCVCFLQTLL